MRQRGEQAGTIGLLVVHGIGAQEPGETLGKLLAGLRRVAPGSLPDVPKDGAEGQLRGQRIRFYEVYWADLLKGDITRGSFLMNELQSLAWFPWFNLRRGVYGKGSYSFLTMLWRIVTLPLMSSLMLLGYYGARFIGQIASAVHRDGRRFDKGSFVERVHHYAARGREYTIIDRLLDEYVGDVVNYVNSAGGAFYRETQDPPVSEHLKRIYGSIVARFHAQLLRAQADGCEAIHVVAHSLGTVVMYHALRGLGFERSGRADAQAVRAASAKVQHLYTIGSPLEKIRFFWPRLTTSENFAGKRPIVWDNFVSWFDPVAGVLRRYGEWGAVRNHHLLGGGFLRGHVVYEHSPVFLGTLTRGLCGQALAPRRGWRERLRDGSVLLGETFLAPAGLVLVLGIGAAIFALTILMVPFLISLPFRPFYGPETWGPILDGASALVACLFIVSMALAPLIRASRVHKLFWATGGPVEHGPGELGN